MPHPKHCSNSAIHDQISRFDLFGKMKQKWIDKFITNDNELREQATEVLVSMSKTDFNRGFHSWVDEMKQMIHKETASTSPQDIMNAAELICL
jgi:hypothetical protein